MKAIPIVDQSLIALTALDRIADMDPPGIRADDLGRAARIASEARAEIRAALTREQAAQPVEDAPVDTIKHLPLFMRGYDAGMKDAKAGYEAHYDRAAQPAAQEPSMGVIDQIIQDVAELDNAPTDTHEMVVSPNDLRVILERNLAAQPAKWIDDPHDIEQGRMLNPAWLKLHGLTAKEAAQPAAQEPTTDDERELAAMALVVADITSDKEHATAFLRRAGMLDSNGELKEQYSASQPPSAQPAGEEPSEDMAGFYKQVAGIWAPPDQSLREALEGLLAYCAEQNANQGDEATDDPRITAAVRALRKTP